MSRPSTKKSATFSHNSQYELSELEKEEIGKCYASTRYFIQNYCYIYDSVESGWIKFELWPMQVQALKTIDKYQESVILKARQIGLTWLVLGKALWQMIFRPIASISIFSKRDVDAIYLLSEERLRGMYLRLPDFMLEGHGVTTDNAHEWGLENGSTARCFPTNAGDSYTSTLAIVDEADLAEDLNGLLRRVKPTIDNGGKIILLSRPDKEKPVSDFKTIYEEARDGNNSWGHIFLPWYAHTGRTQAWYDKQKRDTLANTKSLDDLFEQYPSTDDEALQPRATDKRIPVQDLMNVYQKEIGDVDYGLTGLTIFRKPVSGRLYVIGADPAEGNPNSDDSSASVVDVQTGEEVALYSGKFEVTLFAENIQKIARYYNEAEILVERNNHGHAILVKLSEDAFEGVQNGHDGRPGWHNSSKGKAIMYTHTTQVVQDSECILHSSKTYQQLASIVGSTLKAPESMYDDAATSFSLALCARLIILGGDVSMVAATVKGRAPSPSEPGERERGTTLRRAPGNSGGHAIRSVKVIRKSTRVRDATPSGL